MGCSLLYLAEASFSRRWSRTPALCSRCESRDFTCRALTTPPRFLAMCFRALLTELGILGWFSGRQGVCQVRYFPLFGVGGPFFLVSGSCKLMFVGRPTSDRVGRRAAAAIARVMEPPDCPVLSALSWRCCKHYGLTISTCMCRMCKLSSRGTAHSAVAGALPVPSPASSCT